MSTPVSPDIEAITATYLLAHSAIDALVSDRVGARHPNSAADPWIKFTQIADTSLTKTLHATQTALQFDCYGGEDLDLAQEEAKDLALTLRSALNDMPDASHSGAVVTAVTFFGPRRVPDSDFEPARERYILDATVTSRRA